MLIFDKRKTGLFDLYLEFSFLTSLFLWFGLYFYDSTPHYFIKNYFFVHLFIIGNWYFLMRSNGMERLGDYNSELSKYFLFQMISLLGVSFEFTSIGPLYLSMIPLLFGIYSYHYKMDHHGGAFNKSIILPVIAIGSFLSFQELYQRNFLTHPDFFMMGLALFWGGGLFYSLGSLPKKDILKKNNKALDKHFFHDLINQTHGLNLFLSHKIDCNNGLEVSEMLTLQNEVKVLQSLLQDHYGHGHKNLHESKEIVTFDIAKESIYHLINTFLSPETVETHFIFKGFISESSSSSNRQKCLIHLPSFYRIFNNLVKNIAEAQSSSAEFCFDYQSDGLHIEVKNFILALKNKKDLADNLRDIILNGDQDKRPKEKRLGLRSMEKLIEGRGGSFHFYIREEYWINEIFLPHPRPQTQFDELQSAA